MLSADVAYPWSWRTAAALAVATATYWLLRLVVKRYRPALYQSLQTEALMLGRRKNYPWDCWYFVVAEPIYFAGS